MMNKVNTSVSVRDDISEYGDPDRDSKTLNEFHYLLWNKGCLKGLYKTYKNGYALKFEDYFLKSDSILNAYAYLNDKPKPGECSHLVKQINPKLFEYYWNNCDCTIGGYIIFPGPNPNDKGWTINQARGCNSLIKDRFDLTLECIRRYYQNETSPLYEYLKRYSWFFKRFIDFKGYVEFFLLQDLVNKDGSIKFFISKGSDLKTKNPIPTTVDEEKELINAMKEFCKSRNKRIDSVNLSSESSHL